MPSYRLLHNNARTGRRTKKLTDLQYLVWLGYLLSADDYGVCPFSARKLQGDDPRLDDRPTKDVQKAMAELVRVGLVRVFEDDGTHYIYQPDWQEWQRIRYPSSTSYPPVPTEELQNCCDKTRASFAARSPKFLRSNSGESSKSDDGLPTASANANANARLSEQKDSVPKNQPPPLVMSHAEREKRLRHCAFVGSRVEVPKKSHWDFRRALGGSDPDPVLLAWYESINAEAELSGEEVPVGNELFAWLDKKFQAWRKTQQSAAGEEAFLKGA